MTHGEEFRLIIQCRVNPAKMRLVKQKGSDLGEYSLVPSAEDIRPYGICAYEKQPNPARFHNAENCNTDVIILIIMMLFLFILVCIFVITLPKHDPLLQTKLSSS
ncbi:hypothetical protein DdX_20998 [Ditylenchus destructor]|uniref:Uncharacterized protein n=1 Tax=Ditylenchus destructor TaxID=166010 RepID=A0AAD4MKD3_9BILA|nr:hypothetical protein DdX_20998 [Ditylenchus destructor]